MHVSGREELSQGSRAPTPLDLSILHPAVSSPPTFTTHRPFFFWFCFSILSFFSFWCIMAAATSSDFRVTQRQPRSCLFCRRRKIKCDKAIPCGNCRKRGNQDSCERETVRVKGVLLG